MFHRQPSDGRCFIADLSTYIHAAIERVLSSRQGRTADLGGKLDSQACGRAIASEI
jgi:hypothetical protein